ncbi:MAG: signal peptidase I [Planctomycetes bacterium]|nr:signal peptidase I [Planctomycetota bacterium]
MYAVRETIESIVIAFVLAFLFRTFEAEAFVIPTGSMSPALQGQHKDVDCTECGYRFRSTASSEGEDRQRFLAMLRSPNLGLGEREMLRQKVRATEVILGVCPMCRQTMAMRPDLPSGAPPYINLTEVEAQTSYPGDRILVNKYAYNHRDPDRWDVIVFKFPGNGEMNYIKRLVGLPNETLQIYQGDIFIRDDKADGDGALGFQIERKPARKIKSMLQSVHDSDYESSTLYNAGWPLRWKADGDATSDDGDWQIEAKAGQRTVAQQFRIKSSKDGPTAWLRYHHYVPQNQDWSVARKFAETGEYPGISKAQWLSEIRPELIRDFNPYNASLLRGGGSERRLSGVRERGWEMREDKYGMHWVGDLALACEVEVQQAQGELHLDLVEGGKHFTCRIDLKSGQATVSVAGSEAVSATADTSLTSPGSYQLLFANVDDQLLLWVDDEIVELSDAGPGLLYDADQVFGERKNAIPMTNESDLGDLAPAGVGARGATLTVHRLEVLRDIYYIATKSQAHIFDYPNSPITLASGKTLPAPESLKQLFTDPATWPRFLHREKVDFSTQEAQLFVMGDNSPASQDCRLWSAKNRDGSHPGGPYLDRRLLIGKAVCVFWPHSWGGIPGVSKLPGFPNFGDMRLVR